MRWVALGCWLVLFLMIVTLSPVWGVHDEPYYYRYAEIIGRLGFTERMMVHLPGSPGPLYGIVQWLAWPFTGLHPVSFRLVNLFFGGLTMLFLAKASNAWRLGETWAAPTAFISNPVVWLMLGVGLSDIPAVCFTALFAWGVARWLQAGDSLAEQWPYAVGAGLALGVAATGRQTALAMAAAPFLYALLRRRSHLLSSIVLGLAVLVPIAPCVLIWKGLKPPNLHTVKGGLAPEFLVWSFAYLGLFVTLANARMLLDSWRMALRGFALGMALNLVTQWIHFTPMKFFVVQKLPAWEPTISLLAGSVMAGAAAATVAVLVERLLRAASSASLAWSSIASLLMACTPIAISSNFSRRYTALGEVVYVLCALSAGPLPRWQPAVWVVGAIAGALTNWSYYQLSGWVLEWKYVLPQGE
jgi:hypothetical protein